MLNKPLDKVVFIDIETTTQYESFEQMPIRMQVLFKKRFEKEINEAHIKYAHHTDDETTVEIAWMACINEVYNIKGPLFAEFNKIICISMGVIDISNPKEYKLKIKSFTGEEKQMLEEFIKSPSIAKFREMKIDAFHFCAHNGMTFDFPILAKRMIYNSVELPYIFDYSDKKPWDIDYFIDTKKTWQWTVYDGGVSLDLLAAAFNVESSKTIMSGDKVKDVYYLTKDMKGIQEYCEFDVFALASIYLKMKNNHNPLVK